MVVEVSIDRLTELVFALEFAVSVSYVVGILVLTGVAKDMLVDMRIGALIDVKIDVLTDVEIGVVTAPCDAIVLRIIVETSVIIDLEFVVLVLCT